MTEWITNLNTNIKDILFTYVFISFNFNNWALFHMNSPVHNSYVLFFFISGNWLGYKSYPFKNCKCS